jgi:hypothetical protein
MIFIYAFYIIIINIVNPVDNLGPWLINKRIYTIFVDLNFKKWR